MRLLGCRRYVRNTAISKDLAQRRAELESEGYVVRPLQPPPHALRSSHMANLVFAMSRQLLLYLAG